MLFLLLTIFTFNNCKSQTGKTYEIQSLDSVVKLEMNLSAFGVESDNFPTIDVYIDFAKDSGSCHKSYYNPKLKPSTYSLTSFELEEIKGLFKTTDFEKLKKEYTTNLSDQPTSTTKIYTTSRVYVIKDYGLKGDYPLEKLYDIIYKH